MNPKPGPACSRLLPGLLLALSLASVAAAADLFEIDFEDYRPGNLADGQPKQAEVFRWEVPKTTAEVRTNVVHTGKHALQMGAGRSLALRRFDGGEGIRLLTAKTQYYDFWVYPDCELSDYIVVARLTDLAGPVFFDLHFASGGGLKVLDATSYEAKMVDVDGRWKPRRWQRVTVKFNVKDQKFDLFLNGEKVAPGGWPLGGKFSGTLSHVMLEGPHAEHRSFAVYYDDLRWTDHDPLAP